MEQFVRIFNLCVFVIFTLMYAYQVLYAIVGFIYRKPVKIEGMPSAYHKFAVIIAARNERTVIKNLIDSIQNQNYPKDSLDVIVIADNCTDDTAEICRRAGAIVYERENQKLIGKGYALDFLFKQMMENNTFDKDLDLAVRRFQQAMNLYPYGVADINTQLTLQTYVKTGDMYVDKQFERACKELGIDHNTFQ